MASKITPEDKQAATDAEKLLQLARDYKVIDQASLDNAGNELRTIMSKSKELEERRLRITRPMDAAKKEIMDFFRGPLQFLSDAERIIKRNILAFQQEQRRIAEQREAEQREKERKERERLEARARKAEESGKVEKAEILREQADAVPSTHIAPAYQTPAGVSTRATWSAEITDKDALIVAVAATIIAMRPELRELIDKPKGAVPSILIDINSSILNAQARALKEHMAIPGTKAMKVETLASRAS